MAYFYEDFSNGLPSSMVFDAPGFTISTTEVPSGFTHSLKTRDIADSESCDFTLALSVPESFKITFKYKTSSEMSYDELYFYVNGVKVLTDSGGDEWKNFLGITHPAGEYIFKWEYAKDSSGSVGDDAAYITDISVLAYELDFTEGSGTELDPYLVRTPNQIHFIRNFMSSHFKQMNDIDLSSFSDWEPIGSIWTNPFTGLYDGNGFKITGLRITNTKTSAGLFGMVTGGTLKNIDVDVRISGANYMGGLVGYSEGITIDNCKTSGIITTVSVGSFCGGLIGEVFSNETATSITNSSSSVTIYVKSSYGYLGGFAGGIGKNYSLSYLTIVVTNCFATGSIFNSSETSNAHDVGGFVGQVSNVNTNGLIISKCFATGDIFANAGGGGFVGYMFKYSTITNCYATGDIIGIGTSQGSLGGFVGVEYGYNAVGYGRNTISYCYCKGRVFTDSTNGIGAFVGRYLPYDSTIIIGSYYYNVASKRSDVIAVGLDYMGMRTASSYVSWDFVNIWHIDSFNAGHPYLFVYTEVAPTYPEIAEEPTGSGTIEDPYKVKTPEQLYAVRNYLSGHFEQLAHIDLVQFANWIPIGDATTKFTGVYNGNNYNITGLTINQWELGATEKGLFGYVDGATLRNIKVDVNITAFDYIGGLIGNVSGSLTVDNCFSSGTITCIRYTGGLIGSCWCDGGSVSITNSGSSVNIIRPETDLYAYGNEFAGFIGTIGTGSVLTPLNTLTIHKCFATGNITTPNWDNIVSYLHNEGAGFVGFTYGATDNQLIISECFATGDVKINDYAGGFVATMGQFTTIKDCYAFGNVSGTDNWVEGKPTAKRIGGFAAQMYGNSYLKPNKIINCYSNGSVCANATYPYEDTGAFVGDFYDLSGNDIVDSFYNNANAIIAEVHATGLTDTQMKDQSSFVNWDFANVWKISPTENEGYPYLFVYVESQPSGGETPSGSLSIFVITGTGLKQATKVYMITDSGLKEVLGFGVHIV